MTAYLITGGAGFIGSNIAEELVARGGHVRILDNFSTGRIENLRDIESRIEIIEGDIRSLVTVEHAVEGIDYILHEAALPSVPRSVADPVSTNEVNVGGTLNVLMAAKASGVKRIVLASSSSIYGNTSEQIKHEGLIPRPMSPYAVSKLAGEHYAGVFHTLYGTETVVLRYFNVFGKHQNPDSQYSAVIPRFCKALLHGESPVIYGDGNQSRDFTHVSNIVHANLLTCSAPDISGSIMNVATGRGIPLMELYRTLSKIYMTDIPAVHDPERMGDVLQSQADISRAERMLGYAAHTSFEDGLRTTAEWFRGVFRNS